MKESKPWLDRKKPSQRPALIHLMCGRLGQPSIPSRRKPREKEEYNNFLPNFRPSFATTHCWILGQLQKTGGQQETEARNYNVVSKRHAGRR